jgi:hypothetical protein
MEQFMDWNPSTNQRLNSREDESVEVLKMIANQNPVAASGLKGAQKAAEEMSYEAIKSGAKDVNDVLADLVAKFGGASPMKSSVGKARAGAAVGATADMDSMTVKQPEQQVSQAEPVQEQPMSPEETQKQNMTQLQQMAMDAMTKKPQTTIWGVIGDILTMGTASKNMANSDRKKLLADITAAQKILGEEPLQAGEKEKALLTAEKKGFNEKIIDALGGMDALSEEEKKNIVGATNKLEPLLSSAAGIKAVKEAIDDGRGFWDFLPEMFGQKTPSKEQKDAINKIVLERIGVETSEKNVKSVKEKTSGFKAGDTRVKDGKTYIRQEDGKWLPKR